MDPRLEEASHAGDLEALHRLLQEDRFLLNQYSATTPSVANNPLHIAALIGHADFVREVLRLNPSLARDSNANGLTPLHLASARGRLAVVRELLSVSGGSDLCGICDGDGLLPVHTAAAKGRVEVLVELMNASPDSVRQLTRREETTVHWAVRSGCYKAVKVLVERIGTDEVSFLNYKDDGGNTIMHLAATMRQFQMVKMLLTRPGIEVNEVNVGGLTVLDVLLEFPNECRDLALIEMIRAAGGKTATAGGKTASERGPSQPSQPSSVPAKVYSIIRQKAILWFQFFLRWSRRTILWLGLEPCHPNSLDKESETPQQTLMVVATLIATITFQPVLSPPGGFNSTTGKTTLGDPLLKFFVFDMVGLFASLSIILLLICVQPGQKQKLMRFLVWVMWIAVYFTALAFSSAALIVFPESFVINCLVDLWNFIFLISVLWVYFRLTVYLFYLVGWWEPFDSSRRRSDTPGLWIALTIKRTLVLGVMVVVPILCVVSELLNFSLITLPTWSCALHSSWVGMLLLPHRYLSLRLTIYLLRRTGCYRGRARENPLPGFRLGVIRTPTIALNAATISGARLFMKRTLMLILILAVAFQVYLLIFSAFDIRTHKSCSFIRSARSSLLSP